MTHSDALRTFYVVAESSAVMRADAKEQGFCSMCGATSGDAWQTRATRPVLIYERPRPGDPSHHWTICDECYEGLRGLKSKVQLTMGHIKDKSKGGDDSPSNLRAVCTNCNEGLQNTALPKPDQIWLLSQIRRATIDDQKAALDWLMKKFGARK